MKKYLFFRSVGQNSLITTGLNSSDCSTALLRFDKSPSTCCLLLRKRTVSDDEIVLAGVGEEWSTVIALFFSSRYDP